MRTHSRSLLVALIACAWASAASAALPGFRFLNLGAGSRAASMGDAQVAVGGDVSAMYWNPALLADIDHSQVSLTHLEWFQSFRMESASVGVRTPFCVLGGQINGLYASQGDLIATDDTGAEQGHFGFYDLSTAIGAARSFGHGLALGLAGKFIVESIDDESYGTVALDGGVSWDTPLHGLRIAGAVTNLGPKSSGAGTDIDLPLTARGGAAYQRNVPAIDGGVTVAADVVTQREDDAHMHLGAEVVVRRILHLNAGLRTGYDSQEGSLGAGVRQGRAQVDYAFTPSSTGLGTTHRFTLLFDL